MRKPSQSTGRGRLDQARPQAGVGGVELGDRGRLRPRRLEARPHGVAPELVEEQAAGRRPRQLDPSRGPRGRRRALPRKWSSTKASSAASTARASSWTSRWSTSRSSTTLAAMSRSPIARASGVTALVPDLARRQRADDAGRSRIELADRQRRIERGPGGARTAAEASGRAPRGRRTPPRPCPCRCRPG